MAGQPMDARCAPFKKAVNGMTMGQIIGGLQVQLDLPGRFVIGFQEYLHQKQSMAISSPTIFL